MPNKPLMPPPGVKTQPSPLLLGEGWASSNLIRFKDSMIQKLAGCARLTSQTFVGICRGLRPFYDFSGNTYIAIGTTDRLHLFNNGAITDITPIRATANPASPLSTTAGSPIVTVTDSTTVLPGDWVNIVTACFVGGLFIQGIYQVTGTGLGTWTFNAGSNATATVAAGGAVTQFTTTTSSHTVGIAMPGFTFANGQSLTIGVPTTVGGIVLSGLYVVTVTGGVATIGSPNPAGSSATGAENAGMVRLAYLLETAIDTPVPGIGNYGSGSFGAGPFGVAMTAPPIGGYQRQWSLDAFGTALIASPTNGGIYVWAPPIGLNNVATLIANAPAVSLGCFVTSPSQQIMAFGCTDPNTGKQDPLLLRFCDVDDYNDWTASATNQAGSFRLSNGALIVGAMQSPGQVLAWTDLDLWVGQYIGFPLVYGFNQIGRNCGLRARRGMVAMGGMVYWLSQNGFFVYDGQAVRPLRCDVWDFIFESIDETYPGSTHLAANTQFNEFLCFFSTAGNYGQVNAYVKYNVLDGVWDYGSLARSAWYDQSIAGNPVASDYTGLLQSHENSTDLDGMTMDSWAQTGWMALADGSMFVSLQRLLVDFVITGTEAIIITVFLADYTDGTDTPRVYGPYAVNSATRYIWVRGRGRYAAVKIESNAHGTFWRLGKIEAVIAPDGRR